MSGALIVIPQSRDLIVRTPTKRIPNSWQQPYCSRDGETERQAKHFRAHGSTQKVQVPNV